MPYQEDHNNREITDWKNLGEAERVQRVFESRFSPFPMTVEDVRLLDGLFRPGGGKKMIFGRPIEELVAEGLLITPDMYRTTTFGPVAIESAKYLLKVLDQVNASNPKKSYSGIEGCTGTGSQTWALAKQGGKLWIDATVEKDPVVALFTRENLERLGLKKLGNVMAITDIVEYLKAQHLVNNGNGPSHDWVLFDPDWKGKHINPDSPFNLADMNPNGEELIRLGLKVAPVAGIKAPPRIGNQEIARIAQDNQACVFINNVTYHVSGRESHQERTIVFVNAPSLVEKYSDKIVENLSVSIS